MANDEKERALHAVRQKVAERLKKDDKLSVSTYIPETVKRNEGDIWVDASGKRWEKKNGIAQSVSKLQSARIPLWCPKCSIAMTNRFDTKMYNIHGMCFECVVKMEGKLRREGKFEAYEAAIVRKNQISWLKYHIEMFNTALEEVKNPQFVQADGTLQNWSIDVRKARADIQKEIDAMQVTLDHLTKEETSNDSPVVNTGSSIG